MNQTTPPPTSAAPALAPDVLAVLDAIDPDALMIKDRHAVRRAVGAIKVAGNAGRVASLVARVERSMSLAMRRAALTLDTAIPTELPIAQQAQKIRDALAEHQVVVVCGATGSGKTTQLPKLCLAAGRGVFGSIGHTQPRRLAARAVAQRVASELGTTLGEGVGFRVRFVDETGPDCRVKLMTDGILLQELKSDPWLNQYDTLILDEAHERSLNIDFLLGVLKRLLKKRADLKLIVTSATIDPARFANYFDEAPVIEVSGRGYPIEMRYAGADERPLPEQVCANVQSLMSTAKEPGDILVFLPGERDIRDAEKALRAAGLAGRLDILPLYARLSAARQAKVFQAGSKQRVVLTTNVAETSLTVPRVRYVIDSGLARIGRYSHRSKMQRLPIEPVARANLDQRAGRCGRLGPGVCIRLFEQEDAENRPAFEAPEIQRSNLAGVILQMAHQRLGRIESFDFMDPPDERLIKDGYNVLRELRALDSDELVTALGKRMASLPLEPRLSRAILAAESYGCLDEALVVVSALAVPDVRERRDEDGAPPSFVDAKSDWSTRLNLWRELHQQGSAAAQRRWCKDHGIAWLRVLEWRDVQRQLRSVCKERKFTLNERRADAPALHRALLTGFVSQIGERVDTRSYRGARGRTFYIFPGSPVARSSPPWIAATELIETSRVFAHGVAEVKPGWILEAAEHLVQREPFDAQWSAGQGRATTRQRAVLFGLSIELRQRVPLAPIDPPGARSLMIDHLLVNPPAGARGGVVGLPFSAHNRSMLDRAVDWEHRLRRSLVDEATLFRFFDQLIPRKVVDEKSFMAWHKKLDKSVRARLKLSDDDLGLGNLPDEFLFPSVFVAGRNPLPLSYRFLPTADADGVTLSLPLPLLAQVAVGSLEWLVPGWLPEKVEKLLRSLPKARRKKLAPIAQTAERFLAGTLGAEQGLPETSLLQALADFARRELGEPLTPGAFQSAPLPDHLRVRVELLDKEGGTIEASRDIEALLKRHGGAGHVVRAPTSSFEQARVTQWSFDDLPEQVDAQHGAVTVSGRPALCDQGEHLALRLFADAQHADRVHAQGVGRLVLQQLRDKRRYVHKQLPDANALTLRYAALGDTDQLFDDLALRAIVAIATEPLSSVRTQASFNALVQRARQHLVSEANRLGALAHSILTERQAVLSALSERLDQAHPAVASGYSIASEASGGAAIFARYPGRVARASATVFARGAAPYRAPESARREKIRITARTWWRAGSAIWRWRTVLYAPGCRTGAGCWKNIGCPCFRNPSRPHDPHRRNDLKRPGIKPCEVDILQPPLSRIAHHVFIESSCSVFALSTGHWWGYGGRTENQ